MPNEPPISLTASNKIARDFEISLFSRQQYAIEMHVVLLSYRLLLRACSEYIIVMHTDTLIDFS
jgi:hypothetical protein